MAINTQDYEKACVVSIDAELAGEEGEKLRKTVATSIDQRQISDFVLDLAGCGFIDSSGLESLLWIKHRVDELFGQVKLINVDDNVRKILEITRLEPRFECHHDLATALKMMR
jgi:anti-sigma B factor antagonist